jgi:hypothetical protein
MVVFNEAKYAGEEKKQNVLMRYWNYFISMWISFMVGVV